MTDERTLNVIREQVSSTTALQNVTAMASDVPVILERSVLYPYFAFAARCTVPTMIGKRSMSLDCLVDGVNGFGATADSFSTEQVLTSDEMQLQSKVSEKDAERTAKRTVTHRLGRQLKMIAPFDVEIEMTGVVYKRFWIVQVGDSRIMADSVTGIVHPLPASAA